MYDAHAYIITNIPGQARSLSLSRLSPGATLRPTTPTYGGPRRMPGTLTMLEVCPRNDDQTWLININHDYHDDFLCFACLQWRCSFEMSESIFMMCCIINGLRSCRFWRPLKHTAWVEARCPPTRALSQGPLGLVLGIWFSSWATQSEWESRTC